MNIEQSIYTCCKARRDTGTTGFGYYSMTPGMEELLKKNERLSFISINYSAPRNQELWWNNELEGDARDDQECSSMAEHHPFTFSYTGMELNGEQAAVFSYGKNLGRDVAGVRPGNILINTLTVPQSGVTDYPYAYFNSPDIFFSKDRRFFVNAPDKPVDLLPNPEHLSFGDPPSFDEIVDFINDDRIDQLTAMIQIVMDHGDPSRDTKQILLCDKKENIIKWIGAVSLVFPVEIAKKFSFTTYSFLGKSETHVPVYDDAMMIGVYTPTINGDPADNKSTNYNFNEEINNNEVAVFDFEQDYFAEVDQPHSYFDMFIDSAFSSDYDMLREYQDFIINRTSYRSLDNDYARGYSCFLIFRFRSTDSLGYLEEAKQFALKYMPKEAVKEMLLLIYSCTVDDLVYDSYFDSILEFSDECIEAGIVEKKFVINKYIRLLTEMIKDGSTERDAFRSVAEKVKKWLSKYGQCCEELFICTMTLPGVSELLSTNRKKWIYIDITDYLCTVLAKNDSGRLFADEEMKEVFRKANKNLIKSETNDRTGLINALANKFGDAKKKAAYVDFLYETFENDPETLSDVMHYYAEQYIELDDAGRKKFSSAAPVRKSFASFRMCIDSILSEKNDLAAAVNVYSSLLAENRDECIKDIGAVTDTLLSLSKTPDTKKYADNLYSIFRFLKTGKCLAGKAGKTVFHSFCDTLTQMFKWFDIPLEYCDKMLEMYVANERQKTPDATPEECDMAAMCYVRKLAEEDCQPPKELCYIGFSRIGKYDRDQCEKKIGEYFGRQSLRKGSCYSVKYDVLIDYQEVKSKASLSEIFKEWLKYVLENAGKGDMCRLIAELLTYSLVDNSLNCFNTGMTLTEYKIKYQDLEAALSDGRHTEFIRKIFNNGPEMENYRLRKDTMLSDIRAAYEEKKRSSPFGRLKSKFGNIGKK